ncbi:MAG: hypothetical protein ACK58M_16010 [Acidobacteriota bacterium]
MIRRDHSTPLGFHPKGKKRSSTDGLTAALEEMRRSGRSTPARRIAGCWLKDKPWGRLADGNREPEGQGGVRRF